MSAILGDEEELINGLGSQVVSGNHSARTNRRWSASDNKPDMSSLSIGVMRDRTDSIDNVHNEARSTYISPGQLYSTESGRLFHAGKILIVLVGLPATSKTLVSVAITRYTRWLGVKTKSFHMADYRRAKQGSGDVPKDYFSAVPTTPEGKEFRKGISQDVRNDIVKFFETGQLAVYDGINAISSERQELASYFTSLNIKVLFIESIITDTMLLLRNVETAINSYDYKGWDKEKAKNDLMSRIAVNRPVYQEMDEAQLSYVKYINFGERLILNNSQYGYLINKIVFFLMNLRDKQGCIYFARCGTSDNDQYVDDEQLNEEGVGYSKALTELVMSRIRERRGQSFLNQNTAAHGNAMQRAPSSGDGTEENSFVVWTATRKRTSDTAMFFRESGVRVRERSQLNQLHPGEAADLSDEEIAAKFPGEWKEYERDPYHARFPRAESYHDLAVRMEPLLLEMERMRGDILIIGHETSLRVLYGYLMSNSCLDIPSLKFTRDELIEISHKPYENSVTRIPITGYHKTT